MTPEEDRPAVEQAARRIVEFNRWKEKTGERQFPRRSPLEILEAHTGGFTVRTVTLAKRALERAGEIEGESRPEGVVPKRRRVSSLPEYGGTSGGEVFTRL